MSEPLKQLPVGVANFCDIRGNINYVYADKTEFLYNLFQSDAPYFLSRPRRFGKTLLVDTLEEILGGHRELFKGLWIDGSDYDWTPNPVIRLNLNGVDSRSVESLESGLIADLHSIALFEGLSIKGANPSEVFKSLFDELYIKHGRKVAVLIDEYDAPITRQIENPELADKILKTLETFFGVLKAKDRERGFTFITGIARFSQASLFPSLNNLVDLTFDGRCAAICGFTIQEFDNLFPKHMERLLSRFISNKAMPPGSTVSDLRRLVLDWFDGYGWGGQTRVLNPWAILNTFDDNIVDDYWTQSGGFTSFLAKRVKERLGGPKSIEAEISLSKASDVMELGENLNPVAALFQTGYLTVERVKKGSENAEYLLKFPNLEVKSHLVPILFDLGLVDNPFAAKKQALAMARAITERDAEGFKDSFDDFLKVSFPGLRVSNKAHCQAIIEVAMFLADQKIKTRVALGEGGLGASFETPDGSAFNLKLTHGPFGELEVSKGRRDLDTAPSRELN
ncbi:MAG: AAA family ATPase [Deltaproteobacteria bacterium]|jgi:hypothetical protein|nr:AAA family ATPase [Deltaproteobacteria bacterium]